MYKMSNDLSNGNTTLRSSTGEGQKGDWGAFKDFKVAEVRDKVKSLRDSQTQQYVINQFSKSEELFRKYNNYSLLLLIRNNN